MDDTKYKQFVVDRGFTYRYYCSLPSDSTKPTVLLLHGFPSSSYDWHHQALHLQGLGYGVLAPDLLGAGGTATPTDWQSFRLSGMVEDLLSILDKEQQDKVVGVGHDWGGTLLAHFAMLHQERFHGFVWLGLAPLEPMTTHCDLEAAMQWAKSVFGYEGCAYWEFLADTAAPEIIKNNRESYVQLIYPNDPDAWRTWLVHRGKTAECVKNDIQLGRASYLSDYDYEMLLKETENVHSAVNWYISRMNDNDVEDSKAIPREHWKHQKPSLYIGAAKDCICPPQMNHPLLEKYGADSVEIKETDAGHWLHLERPNEVNQFMEDWLARLTKQINGDAA